VWRSLFACRQEYQAIGQFSENAPILHIFFDVNVATATPEHGACGGLETLQNLLTVDEERIPATKVEMTFVGGELRYERETAH
jgi:hypothetical protein